MDSIRDEYRLKFNNAKKRTTLDTMVRAAARKLEVDYNGEDAYLQHALQHAEKNVRACEMFSAAHKRLNRIKEKECELLSPGDIFE